MGYPYRYGINSLVLNDHRKKFLDAEFVLGVEPWKGDLAMSKGDTCDAG